MKIMAEIRSLASIENGYKDTDLVCFCFGYTRIDIEKDYFENERQSTILKKITLEKKGGRCDCAQNNPKGK